MASGQAPPKIVNSGAQPSIVPFEHQGKTKAALGDPHSRSGPAKKLSGAADEFVWDGWPDGDFEHHFSWEELKQTNNLMVHWSCHAAGANDHHKRSDCAKNWEDGALLIRYCRGMIRCDHTECQIIIRPQTRRLKIQEQCQHPCRCGGKLTWFECNVVSKIWTYDGGKYFQNIGKHDHARLTHKLHLLPNERAEFEAIVRTNPKAGPLALLVGAPGIEGPGRSVADITSVLANKDRISKERQHITSGPGGGSAETFLQDFATLEEEYPNFILYSQIGAVTVIVMQSPFMRSQLIKEFIQTEAINGLVTDAAHGFWRNKNALLMVSSVFTKDLLCWIPVLFTYSNGASAKHYESHFFALYESIGQEAEERGILVVDELFLDVVDFSEAQRQGKTQAFIRFWQLRQDNTRSEDELREAASAIVKGCREHFQRGVTRLTRISAVIPFGRATAFEFRVQGLFDAEDLATFGERAALIIKEFPKTEPWLSWWISETHAPLLFPAHRKMKPDLWESIPDTTNAEESMHWKLYAATGRDHVLLEGIRSLYAFSDHYQRLATANLSTYPCGVPIRYGSAEPWKLVASRIGRTKPTRAPEAYERRRYKNDGRPPDTAKELAETRSKSRKLQKSQIRSDEKKAETLERNIYQSYPWSNNSCWLDTALELLFNVVAASNHPRIKDRRTWLTEQRDSYRTRLKHYRCISAEDDLKSLFGWLSTVLQREWDKEGCIYSATYFHGYRVKLRICTTIKATEPSYKHYQITSEPQKTFEYRLNSQDHQTYHGKVQSWFRQMTSMNPPPHTLAQCFKTKDGVCLCQGDACDITLNIMLPVCLIIWVEDDDLNVWDFPITLRPLTKEAAADGVVYDMVGRGLHSAEQQHFITRFRTPQGKIYTYDGQLADGVATAHTAKLKDLLSGPEVVLPSGYKTNVVIYHLRGGTGAQRTLYAHQIAAAKRLHQIVFTDEELGLATTVGLDLEGYEQMPGIKRTWMVNPYSKKVADYRPTAFSETPSEKGPEKHLPEPPIFSSPLKAKTPIARRRAKKRRAPSTSPESDHRLSGPPFYCRCGLRGNWNELAIAEPTIECHMCERWSHIACQKGGRASRLTPSQKFTCDDCMLPHLLRQNMIPKPRRKRRVYNSPGKGALVRHGDTYWYPVRLIASRRRDNVTEWQVKWWRGCVFADDSAVGCWVPAERVVDELWQNREERRKIRLGRWQMACQVPGIEDQLLDFDGHVPTAEIKTVLTPHQELLTRLTYQPEDVTEYIPALEDILSNDHGPESLRSGTVPHTGELSLVERAQVGSWFIHNITDARAKQSLWVGRAAYAHAVTLLLANRHKEQILQESKYPHNGTRAEQDAFILEKAYEHQKGSVGDEYLSADTDVDQECLLSFEERLFENSAAAGVAGNHQWGLDAGPHQDNWNPYQYIPSWWNYEDRDERESELEVSAHPFRGEIWPQSLTFHVL
ncbi:hypothetical protein GLOTRDRAFT_70775 [Gloeophyllum trabeum ATCC 11539]|uniref:Zinc finger PHD-type domain-containing protein n=1 Tax=Gloeophyllum trabeum (strain ATCC 11539 / FP-39264 / Madison 617) TaxID=670483 RepID=S7QJ71_GLOTA|nr:uncharacterized protein GLOTRDRAFT_70775 [Gloeophyllum trabeum ATCC 11539]EPQ59388.1 hypothetical protein GLOTRDRAFT_70775 [Gloeophyllum trabeum ATCC 11539]